MSSPRAEREGFQHAIHGTSATEAQPSRVSSEFISVEMEDSMGAAEPSWEPDRPATSNLYRACVNAEGRIFCTRRMQTWLFGLPDRTEALSEPLSLETRPEPASVPQSPESIRPRAQSEPAQRAPGPALAAARPGNDPSVSPFRLAHPNPLSQHPVQLQIPPPRLDKLPQLEQAPTQLHGHLQLYAPAKLEQVLPKPEEVHPQLQDVPARPEGCYPQPKIPQRRSSLYFIPPPAHQAQQSHHPPTQFDDLFRGLEPAQTGGKITSGSQQSRGKGETGEAGSVTPKPAQPEPAQRANMRFLTRPANKRNTIHFGSMLEEMKTHLPVGNLNKNDRAQSAKVSDEREKRPKSLFGSIRNRNPALGAPAEDFNNGRKSSASVVLRNVGKSSKQFFSKLSSWKKQEYNLRVAFIGNQQCGKDDLLSRYTLAASIGNLAYYRPDEDPYRIRTTDVLSLDDFKASAEIWDINHRNVKSGQRHPLTINPFDVVVICVDIGNERNLESVTKWHRVAQRYCPGVPAIVVGLNADLRPDFPTLRLGFLEESTAFTLGQGEEAARKIRASAYYECSAKTGEGVTEFLESLVRFSVQATRTRQKVRKQESRSRFSNLFRKK